MNVLNGGVHAANNVDFQEFMVMPVGRGDLRRGPALGRRDLPRAARGAASSAGCTTGVGDEGGFAPDLADNETAVKVLVEAIERTGRAPGDDVAIALDPAASEFYRDGAYHLDGEGRVLSSAEMVDYWADLAARYPIVSIEDGMAERRRRRLGRADPAPRRDHPARRRRQLRHQLRPAARGIERGVANAILIKLNQIGTLTETLDTVDLARRSAYGVVISHRSGETEDVTIADLAVARQRRADKDRRPGAF